LLLVTRGPFATNEHIEIKMGDPFREGVTMKPCSKVGGKISQTVIYGFSNKMQDDFCGIH
tara:strand:- start:54 stop:233 length:180 start_codon:yes stop_codon:yes gene_type:complete